MGNACLILVNHHFCCLNHHFGHDFFSTPKNGWPISIPCSQRRRKAPSTMLPLIGQRLPVHPLVSNNQHITRTNHAATILFVFFFTDGSPSNTFPLSLAGLWILSRTNFAKPSWMPSTSLPIGRNFWRTSVYRSVGSVELEIHATGWTETGFDGEPGTQLGIKHPRKQW